jgi:hypothetical protein
LTHPIPEPVAPVTVIQVALLDAVHEQLVPVVTDSVLGADPVDGTDTVVGETRGLAHCADAVRASTARSRTTSSPRYRMAWKPRHFVHISRLEKARNSGLFVGSVESKGCRIVRRPTSLSEAACAAVCGWTA